MNKIDTNVQHIAQFDINIIKKFVRFPLNFDGIGYICDKNNQIIAQKCCNISRECVQDFVNMVNDIYFNTDFDENFEINLFTLDEHDMNICYENLPIISIRGWGRFCYEKNGDEIYTNIGKFLTFCCNRGKLVVDLLN